jgi:nitroreductase
MVDGMTTIMPHREELLGAVAAAIRAPSVHNTQPWLFRLVDGGVEVHADPDRQLPVADPTGRALRLSCGAAIFNLRLALHHLGYVPAVCLAGGAANILAMVTVAGRRPPTPQESALYAAIPRRHSNRYPFLDTAVALDVRAQLIDAARGEGSWLDLIVGPAGLDMVTQLARAADKILTADLAYRAEVAAWTRTDADSDDGVTRSAGGPAPVPHDLLAGRDFGGTQRMSGHDFEPDPLVGVLGAMADSPRDDVTAGQALQRVLLTATRYGLSTSLMSQPIEVERTREQLRLGLRKHGPPQMLLRFGYGVPTTPTARRPVTDVLLTDGGHQGFLLPAQTGPAALMDPGGTR